MRFSLKPQYLLSAKGGGDFLKFVIGDAYVVVYIIILWGALGSSY